MARSTSSGDKAAKLRDLSKVIEAVFLALGHYGLVVREWVRGVEVAAGVAFDDDARKYVTFQGEPLEHGPAPDLAWEHAEEPYFRVAKRRTRPSTLGFGSRSKLARSWSDYSGPASPTRARSRRR